MALGPEREANLAQENSVPALPAIPAGELPERLMESGRSYSPAEVDPISFESVHGHEEWHQSLRYPQ